MVYRLVEFELSNPPPAVELTPEENGIGLIGRWHDQLIGFEMIAATPGSTLSAEELRILADQHFAPRVLIAMMEAELAPNGSRHDPLPSLSVAICTKDGAQRLSRLLKSLVAVRRNSPFDRLEIVVVDNASRDTATREAVESFDDIRYVFEPKAGLDFARNAALHAATGALIAYLDDDVLVDRNWLAGLAKACGDNPGAGGFTGLVLPYRLDTEAQIDFERRGGFGRGFYRNEFHSSRFDSHLHPVDSGVLGAGCNMAFDRALLIDLGGFDEALDTGAPLPGGGDLDIFYRVLRSGRTMVYEPQFAVYHEHRQTIAQLRRQYWSWGLGMMAFLVKSRRSDHELRSRHDAMVRRWFVDQARALVRAASALRGRDVRFRLNEIWGGICGLAGEYDRSCTRIKAIRELNR